MVLIPLQNFSQTVQPMLRSAGFYISPGIGNLNFSAGDSVIKTSPRMGISTGFRFNNRLKHGFFIESGLNYTYQSANYPAEDVTVSAYGRLWTYKEARTAHNMYLSVPFLAGYKSPGKKIKFQIAAGFSFALKFSDYNIIKTFGTNPFSVTNKSMTGDILDFGTELNAIVRSGISVRLGERLIFDISPSFRYHFVSFSPNSLDIFKSSNSDKQKWFAGLDLSLMWKIQNAEEEITTIKPKSKNEDYTYRFSDEEINETPVKKPDAWGYKNYVYLEIAGSSVIYSVNYERRVFSQKNVHMLVRGGFGMVGKRYAIPLGANFLFGYGTRKFEAGLTTNLENVFLNEFNVDIAPSIAFRWVTRENFILRLSVNTHVLVATGDIIPGIGLSVGGGFK